MNYEQMDNNTIEIWKYLKKAVMFKPHTNIMQSFLQIYNDLLEIINDYEVSSQKKENILKNLAFFEPFLINIINNFDSNFNEYDPNLIYSIKAVIDQMENEEGILLQNQYNYNYVNKPNLLNEELTVCYNHILNIFNTLNELNSQININDIATPKLYKSSVKVLKKNLD